MRYGLTVAVATTLLAAVACGAPTSSSAGAGGGDSSAPGVAKAKAAAAKAAQRLPAYPVPSETVDGVSALKGRTVYYVPITQQAPQFGITARALKKALGAAGLELQVCNGGSNPSQVSSCVNQAVGARAGAIITDSIPYGMAANALGAAQKKKIPVLISDQIPDPAHPASGTLAYLEGGGRAMLVAAADWIIADSAGGGKVLINMSTDSPSTKAYVASAQAEFKARCPKCKVVVNPISSANFSMIASSTSSALLRNPGVQYVLSEFEQYLQPTLGGIQQSGKSAKVTAVTTAAQVGGLQTLKGGTVLKANVGQASAFQGWASTDAVLRMMLKQKVRPVTTPIRLFTTDNVGSVKLTSQAEDSGSWFGPADFPAAYQKLWGVG